VSPQCQALTDPDPILSDPGIDAAVIITPASTHYQLVKQALTAGKHVLCEKPLCLTAGECEELCRLADSRGLKLMVSHTFLFNQGIKKLKDMIDEQLLGEVYYLTSTRTHMGLVRHDVNVMWDLAPHDVSIMCYLTGELPEKVSAVGSSPLSSRSEDVSFINLFFPRGVVGHIQVSWVDPQKVRLVTVSGSRGKAVFDDLSNVEPVRLFEKGIDSLPVESDYGQFRFLVRDGDIISPKVNMKEPLATMVDAFVRLVLDGEANISDGRFGLNMTKILEAAQQSMENYGEPVAVP
jgi:predicted dehydrogenase